MHTHGWLGVVTDAKGSWLVLEERTDAARRYLALPSRASEEELLSSLELTAGEARESARSWPAPPHHPIPGSAKPIWASLDRHPASMPVEEALSLWIRGEALLEARALKVLEFLSRASGNWSSSFVSLLDSLSGLHTYEERAGIRQMPLRTPTLPPAMHTNTYLIGDERFIAVDPATPNDDERRKLEDAIRSLTDGGATFDSVVLTHHHPDHVGAAEWLANRFNVPVRAHGITKKLLQGEVSISVELDEGDVIDLGRDRAGNPFLLEVWFTPGHAPGHIVLLDLRDEPPSMIAGDMVAAVGTIIIDPPEGDMRMYLEQLARMLQRRPSVLYPAHGPMIADGSAKLSQYIAHRNQREAKVLRALAELGPNPPEGLLSVAYDDTPQALYPLAARSCLAHLLKLCAEDRASVSEGQYSLKTNEP